MKHTDSLKRWLGLGPARPRTPALGQRELAVLEVLWAQGTQSAQQTQQQLGRDISLSTVQSTLERLHRKGLLSRNKQGRAFVYRAAISKTDIITNLLHDIAADLSAGDMAPMVSGFMDYLADTAPDVGDRLSKALQDDQHSDGGPRDS